MIRASSIHRYRQCPGAPFAERELPDFGEKSWTREGTQVHEAIMRDEIDELPEHLVEIAEKMADSTEYLVDRIFPKEEGIERLRVIQDEPEPFYVTHEGEKIISGHPDFIQIGTVYGKRTALIIDYKTGFLDVPAPEANDQLRSYAVMVWQDRFLKIDEVYASVIPRFRRMPAPVHYSSSELPEALADLVDVWKASKVDSATRKMSVEACRYCRARATSRCPETLNPPQELINMESPINLSPEQKGQLLLLCEIVTGNIKTLKERLFEELTADPAAVAGWEIAPGQFRASIPDSGAAWNAVSSLLTSEQFQACLKVNKTDLEGELKGKLKETENIKGKAAQQRINSILEPVIVKKQGEPKLAKKEAA